MLVEQVVDIAGLETTVVGRPEDARVVVVLLHGFAMRPSDLAPFAHSLGVPGLFLFPRGPLPGALEPGVATGRAWWHIDPVARAAALARGPRDFSVEHPSGLGAAREGLWRFLGALGRQGFAPERAPLVLGGFSQGGMLACDTFLRPEPNIVPLPRVDALLLLSASRLGFDEWIPRLAPGATPSLQGLPVFISHGQTDPDLAFSAGDALRACLTTAGASITWVPFDQGHEIPLVVWRRLRKFLLERCVSGAPGAPYTPDSG